MNRVRSRTRHEYPHSLSYHARTLIRFPSTSAVEGRSTMDECGLPLKSHDTSSSSVTSRMPRSRPAAASRNASFTALTVAGLASSATRSTTDTFAVGTRMAMPSSFPLSLGSTRPTAVAAPVVVGIMLTAAARARRRSLCGKSCTGWSFVYECPVEAKPRLTPNASSSTFTVVARQFVVHDAFETIRCFAGSYACSLTPRTIVTSGSFAGAVIMTFLAPACRCLEAVAVSRKMPVDSTTTSTPRSFHGSAAGSFSLHTRISRPSTKIASPFASTLAASVPWTESCFSRCARVFASAKSLTATTSMSLASRAVRKKTRPMRPNPLTPTRRLMEGLLVDAAERSPGRLYGASDDAGNCQDADPSRAGRPQRPRALGERRPGGEHIVHHEHVVAGDGGRRAKRPADVRPALGRGQVALRSGRPHAREPARLERCAELSGDALGEEPGLVEPSDVFAITREGDRDDGRDAAGPGPAALLEQEGRERARERAPSRELERVQRFPQRPLVARRAARPVVRGRLGGAPDARHPGRRCPDEARARASADDAVGRGDALDRLPAPAAQRIAAPGTERGLAHRAESRENEIQDCRSKAREAAVSRRWARKGAGWLRHARFHRQRDCLRGGRGAACSSDGTPDSGPATRVAPRRTRRTGAASRTRSRASGRGGIPRRPRASLRAARRRRRGTRAPPAGPASAPRSSRTGPRLRRASRARGRPGRGRRRGPGRPALSRAPRGRARSSGSAARPAGTHARAGPGGAAPDAPPRPAPKRVPPRGARRAPRGRRPPRVTPEGSGGRRGWRS